MDRRAAGQRLRRPLAVVVLLAAIPVALGSARSLLLGGGYGIAAALVLVAALTAGLLAARATVGIRVGLSTMVTTLVAGGVAAFGAFVVGINTSLCGKDVHHGWLAGVAGVGVYFGVGYFGVRRGSTVWMVPLAIVAAVAAALAVSALLPGTQGICET